MVLLCQDIRDEDHSNEPPGGCRQTWSSLSQPVPNHDHARDPWPQPSQRFQPRSQTIYHHTFEMNQKSSFPATQPLLVKFFVVLPYFSITWQNLHLQLNVGHVFAASIPSSMYTLDSPTSHSMWAIFTEGLSPASQGFNYHVHIQLTNSTDFQVFSTPILSLSLSLSSYFS